MNTTDEPGIGHNATEMKRDLLLAAHLGRRDPGAVRRGDEFLVRQPDPLQAPRAALRACAISLTTASR